MFNKINKIASAVRSAVNSGLQGLNSNGSLSMELIEDAVVMERLQVLKEYSLKGILPTKDLYISVNCIPIDCKDLERCRCRNSATDLTPTAHFEIPQIVNDYGGEAIDYIGSDDRMNPFIYYTSATIMKLHKYRKRGKNKPYVWIDTTPNENGKYDCFVFNAPLLKLVSVSAIFKDFRQLEGMNCCSSDDNFSFIDNEVIRRLTEKYVRYYRQLMEPIQPNNQTYDQG